MILKENDFFVGLWNAFLVSGLFYASLLYTYLLFLR